MMNTPFPANTPPLVIEIANLTPADLIFLRELHALFCDPAQADALAQFRAGRLQASRDPRTGRCVLNPLCSLDSIAARN